MRTFSRSDWETAQEAWLDFSGEWREVRHQAAMRGMLYPPDGTRFDSWEDDSPSQRAMLIRAIRETPKLLAVAVSRSRTWGEVIKRLIGARDDWRAEMAEAERREARRRLDEEGPRRGPLVHVGPVARNIADSVVEAPVTPEEKP